MSKALKRRLARQAVEEDRTLSDLMADAAEEYLARKERAGDADVDEPD
jgi:predicted transcriptional regulator